MIRFPNVPTAHPFTQGPRPGAVVGGSPARVEVAGLQDGAARPSRRLPELDALRGVAAVVVLLHHGLLSADLLSGQFGRWLGATPLQPIRTGRPAVVFFFMLSGFVLTKALRDRGFVLSVRSWAIWAAQRTIRLCLPVAGSVLLSLSLYALFFDGTWLTEGQWLRENVWQQPPTSTSVASEVFLVALDDRFTLNNVLWSLAHEWRFSMLLPLVLAAPVLGRGTVPLVLAATAASSWAAGTYGSMMYVGATVFATVKATLYFSLPFVLGTALELSGAARRPAGHWTTVLGLAAVLGLCRNGSDYAIFIGSALLIWLALQPGLLQRVLRHPALSFLGTISFSLYLVHVPLLAALQHGLRHRVPSEAICALGVSVSLPAAWLFYEAIERPAHRLARYVDRGGSLKELP